LPAITKHKRSKALLVSWLSPQVSVDDAHKSMKEKLNIEKYCILPE
jgi:hypothetical protein